MKNRKRRARLVREIPVADILTALFVMMKRPGTFSLEQLRSFIAKEGEERSYLLFAFVPQTTHGDIPADRLSQLLDELVAGKLLWRQNDTFRLAHPGRGYYDARVREARVLPRHKRLIAGLVARFEEKLAAEARQPSLFQRRPGRPASKSAR